MKEEIHNTSKGVCVILRGRYKTKFVLDPELRTWSLVGKGKVSLRCTGRGTWRVSAPTIGGGKVSIFGPKARHAAFSLAATHAI